MNLVLFKTLVNIKYGWFDKLDINNEFIKGFNSYKSYNFSKMYKNEDILINNIIFFIEENFKRPRFYNYNDQANGEATKAFLSLNDTQKDSLINGYINNNYSLCCQIFNFFEEFVVNKENYPLYKAISQNVNTSMYFPVFEDNLFELADFLQDRVKEHNQQLDYILSVAANTHNKNILLSARYFDFPTSNEVVSELYKYFIEDHTIEMYETYKQFVQTYMRRNKHYDAYSNCVDAIFDRKKLAKYCATLAAIQYGPSSQISKVFYDEVYTNEEKKFNIKAKSTNKSTSVKDVDYGEFFDMRRVEEPVKKPVVLSKERKEEPYMFTIGNDTIEKMNKIKVEIDSTDLDQMSGVIIILKNSVDRYKEYSDIGFFKKMFTNKLEIQANITIAVINFENALEKGDVIRKRLIEQYSLFENCSSDLKKIYDEFNDRIKEIDDLLSTNTVDHNDANRLIRRKNDLISAQLLSANSAAQFELSKANVATLIDKFESIEKILKPVITQNIQLSKEMYRVF